MHVVFLVGSRVVGPTPLGGTLHKRTLLVVANAQLTRRCTLQMARRLFVSAKVAWSLVPRLVCAGSIGAVDALLLLLLLGWSRRRTGLAGAGAGAGTGARLLLRLLLVVEGGHEGRGQRRGRGRRGWSLTSWLHRKQRRRGHRKWVRAGEGREGGHVDDYDQRPTAVVVVVGSSSRNHSVMPEIELRAARAITAITMPVPNTTRNGDHYRSSLRWHGETLTSARASRGGV